MSWKSVIPGIGRAAQLNSKHANHHLNSITTTIITFYILAPKSDFGLSGKRQSLQIVLDK